MPDLPDPETMGPVDVALILFEGNEFNGDVAPALAELQQNGTVRIIDLVFVIKDADGVVSVVEATDTALSDAYAAVSDNPLDLLSDEDLESLADQLDPDSSALAVVWENTWAARLGMAVRGSGGEVVAQYRIPHETVTAAIDALREE